MERTVTRLRFLIVLFVLTGFSSQQKYIDPTGTYKLDGETINKDGEIYGYFGQIQIKKLALNKIIMAFEVCKGATSYNSGSFLDTLDYIRNRTVYMDPELDSSCKITFIFGDKGTTVKEETEDFNFGCGFGHSVIADGFYKRISKQVPEISIR